MPLVIAPGPLNRAAFKLAVNRFAPWITWLHVEGFVMCYSSYFICHGFLEIAKWLK